MSEFYVGAGFGVAEGEGAAVAEPQGMMQAGEGLWWGGAATKTDSGERITQDSALTFSAVWAATRAIAETLASLPALVYRYNQDWSRERARGSQWDRLLHREPNQDMDSFTFYELMSCRLVNAGNAFAEMERNNADEVIGLWPIHNSRVRAWRLPGGELEYHVYSDEGNLENGLYYIVPRRDMLNIVGPHSYDGILGPGVIPRAAQSIGLGIATERYGASFFGSGGRPSGVLEHPSRLDPETRANIRREWNEVHAKTAGGRWHEVAVLWEGMKYNAIGIAPEQAQFLETRRHNVQTIAQWYGVSPAIIQDFSDSKFATVEAQLKHFVLLSLRPWAVRWERALGRQVFGIDSMEFLEFAMNALLRGDPKAQAEANEVKFRNGVLNADEWRQQDNDNPLPGGAGQRYWINNAFSPVEDRANAARAIATRAASGGAKTGVFAQRVFAEAVGRIQAVERTQVLRLLKAGGDWAAAVREAYERLAPKLSAAIALAVAEIGGGNGGADAWAGRYCERAALRMVETNGEPSAVERALTAMHAEEVRYEDP